LQFGRYVDCGKLKHAVKLELRWVCWDMWFCTGG